MATPLESHTPLSLTWVCRASCMGAGGRSRGVAHTEGRQWPPPWQRPRPGAEAVRWEPEQEEEGGRTPGCLLFCGPRRWAPPAILQTGPWGPGRWEPCPGLPPPPRSCRQVRGVSGARASVRLTLRCSSVCEGHCVRRPQPRCHPSLRTEPWAGPQGRPPSLAAGFSRLESSCLTCRLPSPSPMTLLTLCHSRGSPPAPRLLDGELEASRHSRRLSLAAASAAVPAPRPGLRSASRLP